MNHAEPLDPGFPEVYYIDTEDDVLAGDLGVMNLPFKQLVERDAYLNKLIEAIPIGPNRPIGVVVELRFQPSPLQLLKWRYLPLKYQIIKIALYQDLCDCMWVGATDNDTEHFWYRCDVDGTRNVNGDYMRVGDDSGMFRRGAGVNAVFKGANDTPYDGKEIGAFRSDTTRVFNIEFETYSNARSSIFHANSANGFHPFSFVTGSGNTLIEGITAVPMGNFSHETAGASISGLTCITY
jgi:hypothetical protein